MSREQKVAVVEAAQLSDCGAPLRSEVRASPPMSLRNAGCSRGCNRG